MSLGRIEVTRCDAASLSLVADSHWQFLTSLCTPTCTPELSELILDHGRLQKAPIIDVRAIILGCQCSSDVRRTQALTEESGQLHVLHG